MRFARTLLAVGILALLTFCSHSQIGGRRARHVAHITAPPSGIAIFTRHNQYVEAQVSPRGTYVALVSDEQGDRSLVFLNLATHETTSVLTPGDTAMVGRFFWVNDKRVVIELVDPSGDLAAPVNRGELFAVDADGKGGRLIFGYRAGERQAGSHIRKAERDFAWARVIATLPHDDKRVLIEEKSMREVGDLLGDLYKLNVYTGVKDHVIRAPAANVGFVTDETGEPRIATGLDKELGHRFFYREADSAWREMKNLPGLTRNAFPHGFIAHDRPVYASDGTAGPFGFFAVNLDSGERKLVAKNDIVESSSLLVDPTTGRAVAVEYQPDMPVYEILVPEHPFARVISGLLETYPDEHVRLLNSTTDGKQALLLVYSDRDPGKFLLVDADTMQADEIAQVRPWIRPESMAQMSAFHIPASDGLTIHGYITQPRDADLKQTPPMVVLPHGGPHGIRDEWGFDSEAQLLASEGFAVLQVNYRGSAGYGPDFEKAGYRHWGDRVIQDILDATRFAIRKGFADPKRICIYGGSFGGYAALQSTIVAPDLFRCAVGYSGVYDLSLLDEKGDIPKTQSGRDYLRAAVGENAAALRSMSPVYNADKLVAPALLIHGAKDKRAPIEHAELLREALTAAGRAPQWLVESDEGHGFYDEDARERMYTKLVSFLKENTGRARDDSARDSLGSRQ